MYDYCKKYNLNKLALVQTLSSNIASGVKFFCSKCYNMFLIDLENASKTFMDTNIYSHVNERLVYPILLRIF